MLGWAASVATIPTRSAEKSPAEDDLVEQGQRFHASAEEAVPHRGRKRYRGSYIVLSIRGTRESGLERVE